MEILKTLLEITVYSGIIYLAIILFKKVFKKKLSPALSCFIWVVLLVRLAIPVTFQSAFSLIKLPASTNIEYNRGDSLEPSLNDTPNISLDNGKETAITGETSSEAALNQNAQTSSGEPATPGTFSMAMTAEQLLVLVWIAGVIVSTTYLLMSYPYLKRYVDANTADINDNYYAVIAKCRKELGIPRHLNIRIVYKLRSPALLLGSTILLPHEIFDTMNKEQIKMSLMHEYMHYKRKDHVFSMLMLVFRSIYWFNPIVWLANKEINDDIEVACDSAVSAGYSKSQRIFYAQTILEMYTNNKPQFALGMALGGTQKIAEKRIRGIFMEKKSKKSTIGSLILLTAILAVACFTTACQPVYTDASTTPESTISTQETASEQNNHESNDEQAVAPAQIEFPKYYSDTFSIENVTVTLDAEVVSDNANAPSAVQLKREAFTQEDVDKIKEYFFGDTVMRYQNMVITKSDWEAELARLSEDLQAIEPGSDPAREQSLTTYIAEAEEAIKTAPDTAEDTANPLLFDSISLGARFELLDCVVADSEGRPPLFSVTNTYMEDKTSIESTMISIVMEYGGTPVGEERPLYTQAKSLNLTPEQAETQALEICEAFGLTDMNIKYVALFTDEDGKEEYYVMLSQSYDGIIVNEGHIFDEANQWAFFQKEPNSIIITIDDDGVNDFSWDNKTQYVKPLSVPSLRPFEEIMNEFMENIDAKYVVYKNSIFPGMESDYEIFVDRIELEYICLPDSEAGYSDVVLAWNFYCDTPFEHGESPSYADGSVCYLSIPAFA